MLDEEMNEMLAHPLFGRQGDVLAAQDIEYHVAVSCSSETQVVGGKVQLIHSTFVH